MKLSFTPGRLIEEQILSNQPRPKQANGGILSRKKRNLWLSITAIALSGLAGLLSHGPLPATVAQTKTPTTKTATLTVRISGFLNDKGEVGVALYNSQTGYDQDQRFRETAVSISKQAAVVTFRDLPPGTYAVVAHHDENKDGEWDTDGLGIPTEGGALSNDPEVTMTHEPTFDECKFTFEGDKTITIKMQY